MTEEQVRAAMAKIADDLRDLQKEIKIMQGKLMKSKKSGDPVDIDDALRQLSDMSIRMAAIVEVTKEWRKRARAGGIKIDA